jgi:hypothetical protein
MDILRDAAGVGVNSIMTGMWICWSVKNSCLSDNSKTGVLLKLSFLHIQTVFLENKLCSLKFQVSIEHHGFLHR